MGRKKSESDSNQPKSAESPSSAPTSTTSLGKRRSLAARSRRRQSRTRQQQHRQQSKGSPSSNKSSMSTDYGSQGSPMRMSVLKPGDICKVAILGAAGGIGQPLSMLLMLHSEYIQHLALYDLVHVRGVGADLAHIDRQCLVTTHMGPDELAECVKDAKAIVIPAGLAQKPGMSRDDLFGSNAKIMYSLAKVCAQHAPNATLAIISNPVNSLVPLTCEVYQRFHKDTANCLKRIFGVTTLDVVRASSLTSRSAFFKEEPSGLFKDPSKICVPVIGGHAGKTIVPVLSQATPKIDENLLLEKKQTVNVLIESIQEAGIEVLNAKKGRGSATLAMAYAACRFTISLLRAMQGEQNIIECAFVKQSGLGFQDLDYFATPLVLGRDGWTKSLGIGKLLPFEQQMIEEAARELKTSVAKGEDFAKEQMLSDK